MREESSTSGDIASPNNIADISISFLTIEVLFNSMVIHVNLIVPRDSLIQSV